MTVSRDIVVCFGGAVQWQTLHHRLIAVYFNDFIHILSLGLEAFVPVTDRLTEVKNLAKPATILQWAMRLLWNVIGATSVFLLVATVAPRFLDADQPWVFFLLGSVVGVPVSAIHPLLSLFPSLDPYRTPVLLLGMVVVVVVASVVTWLTVPGIELSPVGIGLAALGVTAVCYFMYLVHDAPEPAPNDR